MNHYLFLPITALITNTLLVTYVFARRFRSAVIADFLRFAFFLDLWLLAYILYWGMLPAEWMTPIFKLTCFTWIPAGLLYLEVVFRFLNRKSKVLLPFFRFVILFSILVTTVTDWVIKGSVLYDWGYELDPGWFFVPMSLLAVSAPAYTGLFLLIRERFRTKQEHIKSQLDFWIVGTVIAFSLSMYTELLNLDQNGRYLFPPLTPVAVTIQTFFIFIAITRFGFLNISMERIAIELFRDIQDGIILTKEDGEFFYANQAAISLIPSYLAKASHFHPGEHFLNYSEADVLPKEYALAGKTQPEFIELTKSRIRISESESGILYLLHDVTERKSNQEKIVQLYSQIVTDLEIARVTQSSIITQKFPERDRFKLYSFFQPIDKVGGDMLRVIEHPSGRVDILFADVSGHGIASAMVGGMLSITFQVVSQKSLSPKESLEEIHSILSKMVLHHHISAIYVSYYPEENRIDYSYAGHHPILILRDGKLIPLQGEGRILLAIEETYLNNYSAQVKPSDRVIFYSDGFFEVRDQEGDILGYSAFYNWLQTIVHKDTPTMLEAAIHKSLEFGNGKTNDDLAMLAMEIRPA
ncbi:serine/threonine protein phosphatase [Leptospira perolatii]|uniref:Serine/threonine protein phosphatase n=1 Tax=Leptospira perolatii TaxID=2023191 RepID=A0A2M9ZSL7_9LEPT|nr:SpoIIE family protein phosphatase [Leptospira perolatii]PJZ68084.1 serine/threonine protein phosphatase [Leptospira perolatii]PJZ75070.1 serine/threonine protein phosphatase [Leptospira perolatii]